MKYQITRQRNKKYSSKDSSFEEDDSNPKKSLNNQKIKNTKGKKKFKKISTKKLFIKFKLLIPIILLLFSIIFYCIYNMYKKKMINNIIPDEEIQQTNLYNKTQSNIFEENELSPYNKSNYDFQTSQFNIITKKDCEYCGFFSYFIEFLGCFITSISSQQIPIIDIASFPNVLNGFSSTDSNPWDIFFDQPYNLTLKEVENKASIKRQNNCSNNNMSPNYKDIYSKKYSILFYHNIVKTYIPIKKEIIKEVEKLMEKLFGGSQNVLGVLARGTDYITLKKEKTPIPPKAEKMIEDVKKFDSDNKYKFIFLATEDYLIKEKFKNEFGNRLKFLEPPNKIEYNYQGKEYFNSNKNAQGLEFQKFYFFNIMILSNCIDIISTRTDGEAEAFILAGDFRNKLIYDLGEY